VEVAILPSEVGMGRVEADPEGRRIAVSKVQALVGYYGLYYYY
jgi:hypothetical protein